MALPAKILLLGQTGAGKSTFINAAAGQNVTAVGHGIIVTLIDTPGFNDSNWKDDTETLTRIVNSLTDGGIEPTGIIYLHEITLCRNDLDIQGSLMGPIHLSNPSAVRNVVLTTTKWGKNASDEFERRQKELNRQWKTMLDKGSQTSRFANSTPSAWEVIDLLPQPGSSSQIRAELVRVLQALPQQQPQNSPGGFFSHLFGKFKPNRR
ncbi:hypothetical protein BV22DRAFT_440509 [Leucogyrophana mollusca]|uniref:Uncharacterized protein n=1 Tax=Leucogyrophana mollusca TaxID=85980 RepID=A0ACB8BIK4_9AGAM|nr:hypothetical protein BV22DRAFT_440509 [Leucogyrophana mollusca]